ncbi:MAG: glycogen synthase [Candidatus Eisenbacteria bacterium]
MKTKLCVSIASAEMEPYAKVGGLADVVGSLSRTLASLGHDVSVFLPKYGFIKTKEHGLKKVRVGGGIRVGLGDRTWDVDVWNLSPRNSRAQVYFIGNESLLERDGIYCDPKTREDYADNGLRFAFFSKAVLEVLKALSIHPDVIHCNDHQTGLIPLFLNKDYSCESDLRNAATLFTIHNLGYQGVYPRSILAQTGLPEDLAYPMGPLEFWGKLNFMKASIVFADLISTVSKTYAAEIQTDEEYGFGLQGVLRARHEDLYGVLNGVDYVAWNPSRDKHIPYKYSLEGLEGKLKNKMHVIEKYKLSDLSEKSMLIGVVSRLADQKGFDLIPPVVERMLSMDIGLLVLGTGQQKYHDYFEQLRSKYPGKVSVTLAFDDKLAHLVEAASDVFLMPSKYEPCGLNQMYSMRYGTIPLVRHTGGLADTVQNVDASSGEGTGFSFRDYTPDALMETVARAYETFQDRQKWSRIVRNAMSQDFSWKRVAQGYEELYRKAVGKRRSTPFASWVCSLTGQSV